MIDIPVCHELALWDWCLSVAFRQQYTVSVLLHVVFVFFNGRFIQVGSCVYKGVP